MTRMNTNEECSVPTLLRVDSFRCVVKIAILVRLDMDLVPDERCDLESLLHAAAVSPQPGLSWLGQAGFLIRWGQYRLVIDPYLSDSSGRRSIAARGSRTCVWCRRRLSLSVSRRCIRCSARMRTAITWIRGRCRSWRPPIRSADSLFRGLSVQRRSHGVCLPNGSIAVNAGDRVQLAPDLALRALPAAHEQVRTDEQGDHHYPGLRAVPRLHGDLSLG